MHARPRLRRSPVLLAALLCLGAALAGCSRGGLGYRFLAGDRHYYHVTSRLEIRRGDRSATLTSEYDLVLQVTGVRGRWADMQAGLYNARATMENPRESRRYPMPPDQEWPVLADMRSGQFSGPGGGNPELPELGGARLEDLVGELGMLPARRTVRPGDTWQYELRLPQPVLEPSYLTVDVTYLRDEDRDGVRVAVITQAGGGPMPLQIMDNVVDWGDGSLTVDGTYYLDRRSGLPVAATVSTRLHFQPADGGPDSWITLVQEVDRS